MADRILYLGDTVLDRAASYLAGVMSHYGFEFDYVNSDTKFSDDLLGNDYKLLIISDYSAANFNSEQMQAIADKTKTGMALLMIGGWESFTGLAGDYSKTPIADVLPVIMKESDDRMNFSSPCLVIKQQEHEILDSLPFDSDIPAIGGLNAFDPKPGVDVLLSAVQFKAEKTGGEVVFTEKTKYPLLVVSESEACRTAAFASDVAPHWVGPLVDWGNERVKAQAQGAGDVEVGNHYAKFFANLINWLCHK